ncbi:MAG: efflux RND transporter periplasmic adaptor subunit [Steroidobacteraceae bacterium]
MSKKSIVVVVLLIVGGVFAYTKFRAGAQPPAPQRALAPVTVADIEQTVLATGKLEPKALVSVGAQVSGQVKVLNVSVGETVKKGQLIAEIDAEPQQNAMLSASLSIENLQAQRAARLASRRQAQLSFDRQKKMIDSGVIAKADFDSAQIALESADADIAALDAQIKQATTQMNIAKVNLGYTKIVAPMDGVVVAVVTKQGQTLNANQSAPTIIMVAKLDIMTIKAQISEADVVKVQPGQTVYFTTLGNPDRRYYAKVGQIEPAPESIANQSNSTGTSTTSAIYYNALFDVPNTDGTLYPSMTAQVYVITGQSKQALTIPAAALGNKDAAGLYSVQVVDSAGIVTARKVKVGINTKVVAEVLEGLKPGEQVVIGEATAGGNDNMMMRF